MRVETLGPNGEATLYLGDCLEILPTLSDIDCVLTDPPYSSGGQFRSDRNQSTTAKYVNGKSSLTYRGDFSGDNRDQRSFLAWSAIWMGYLLRASNPGATLMTFSDWRQVPVMTDAIQAGGWIWRNLVTWWKPGIRMQRGRFSGSSEYIIYASAGVPKKGEKSPQNVIQYTPVSGEEKQHIAEKPVGLIEVLLGVTPENATVADPFMGSGAIGHACANVDRRFVGVEIDSGAFDIACQRIADAYKQPRLFDEPKAEPVQTSMFEDNK